MTALSYCIQVYLAMAKGGLTPDHTLVCPIAHYPSTIELPDVSIGGDHILEIYIHPSRTVVFKIGIPPSIIPRRILNEIT